MNTKKKIHQDLKTELQTLAKRPLTDFQIYEAYFNLSGFIKTLKKMRKEAVSYGNAGV